MIRNLLSAAALAALMLAPASPASSGGDPAPPRVVAERPADAPISGADASDISDVAPVPMALLFALIAAGLVWGRRLDASARAAEEAADRD